MQFTTASGGRDGRMAGGGEQNAYEAAKADFFKSALEAYQGHQEETYEETSGASAQNVGMDARVSGNGGEIITLQFGPSANWLGRAFWELQDEVIRPYGRGAHMHAHPASRIIDRGVHFGGGITEDREWPRVLVFDTKKETSLADLLRPKDRDATGSGVITTASYGSSTANNPYELPTDYDFFQENVQSAVMSSMQAWGGAMERFDVAPQTSDPNEGGELSVEKIQSVIRSTQPPAKWNEGWSPRLHKKSLYELQTVSEATPFDVWSYGHEIMSNADEADLYLEGLRHQLEHCDRVHGFQTFVDVDSGFGSFAYDFLREVQSECRSAVLFTYGLTPKEWGRDQRKGGVWGAYQNSAVADRQAKMNVNVALGMSLLQDVSSMYVPLSLGGAWEQECATWLTYDPAVRHHMFCMLGLAVDTVSLPFRTTTRAPFACREACNALVRDNRRKITTLAVRCPVAGKRANDIMGGTERAFLEDSELVNSRAMSLDDYFATTKPVEDWRALTLCPSIQSPQEGFIAKSRRSTYSIFGSLRGFSDPTASASMPPNHAFMKQLRRTTGVSQKQMMSFSYPLPVILPQKFFPARPGAAKMTGTDGGADETKCGDSTDDSVAVDESSERDRFISSVALLRASSDLLPMLTATLHGLKNRPKRVMFEYEKGAKGISYDEVVEIEQSLFRIVEAYTED